MNPLKRLLAITKQLRDPIDGCEWDRMQTFDSLKSYTLEETYEVLDAIDKQDMNELKKELGDLLFQIVFYADLASEQGQFDFEDICQAVADKLVSRHPHIFDEKTTEKPNWEQLKQKERDERAQYSLLDDIPNAIPALMKAEKIQKRCASVGFDWQELTPVLDKVKEELDEVEHELNKTVQDQSKIEEELGDLFFATVNLARHLKVKSELCLQRANHKFERRFKQVEAILKQNNRRLTDATLEEMEAAWQLVKQLEISTSEVNKYD
ncbi:MULTISPECIES: nucleoside triphosphate pyrophosphohydrolase [unclassified Gilliamella]|uniref:nucleoside triphosphate pyrophosphohydrolase n=1 Tax=unclassified Gilliamella TaxID=2685620 RepID=UPI0022697F25|nr:MULTISPECIES: nucleoside triphosphate pyrophosphohydrolase [unclassified Gilliamella]MCX8575153.1 nucleoside triphosphate pyrophosphohydrolase [Gilliamella sp. B3831]MCX8577535.1 nucleoside triphosphate pyrophosphohydrolase [Gilliamella sp. B3815]MCX8590216.1 nucleoside triphosphate pyrophosphohydrolase [Gilliamella sp. B3812]MCX8604485.1 nucleoside triphosphate pyrophosphohydrolase [Gilliamella sp. B3823]MCX8606348.1 nucleoside triphosphate pyrophosphohydrolase [Gilliamella sp. B3825]